MKKLKGPLVLIIMDGWGLTDKTEGNAIACANTPNMCKFLSLYPHTTLDASGEDAGLPEGQMGNSEVGHLNIGAGRIVYQELTRISKSIRDGDFYNNVVLLDAVNNALKNKSSLHIMGLLSDGGVHSHITHLFALLEMARKRHLEEVYIHCFMDGRDTPPTSGIEYIQQLEDKIKELGMGRIATVIGRYYAMDRDRRWERVLQAYRAMVLGEGLKAKSALVAVRDSYSQDKTDEFILPTVIEDGPGNPLATVKDGDSIIFYNFRPDRAREITRAFVDEQFDGFDRPQERPRVFFVCMTQYDKTIEAPVAFRPQRIVNTLGEVLSGKKIKQLRLAETEKYAHVTFFFNGGVEPPNEGEDRILVPSPKVATYDQKPEMSAPAVTDTALEQLAQNKYKVIIMNYANPDMVGHTGNMEATVRAVETVDSSLGRVLDAVLARDGVAIITADHGNAEHMKDENGEPFTAHTVDPVPFILIGNDVSEIKLRKGRLEDIAPTMLGLLGIDKPKEMTGESLIIKE